jgi:hypothetical protein
MDIGSGIPVFPVQTRPVKPNKVDHREPWELRTCLGMGRIGSRNTTVMKSRVAMMGRYLARYEMRETSECHGESRRL